jgi:hypothetical protein
VPPVRTGFYSDGTLEMRPSAIASSYARGWLAVDVVSCLPIPYAVQTIAAVNGKKSTGGNSTKLFKILRLLRLAKLLRLGRLKKIVKRHEEEMESLMGACAPDTHPTDTRKLIAGCTNPRRNAQGFWCGHCDVIHVPSLCLRVVLLRR